MRLIEVNIIIINDILVIDERVSVDVKNNNGMRDWSYCGEWLYVPYTCGIKDAIS